MGIYYDDPDTVPENDLRFAVGSILAEGPEATPDHTELSKYLSDGFKLIHFPKPEFAVVATFPFRTTLSIYLAIWKVYPRLKQYIASRGLCAYPCLEIYDSHVIHVSVIEKDLHRNRQRQASFLLFKEYRYSQCILITRRR